MSNVDTSEFQANIERFMGNVGDLKTNFLNKLALGIVKVSKDDSPVDTGDLKRSIRAEVHADADEAIIMAGYAGVSYAMQVHEDLNAHHDVGKAKYIEDNIRALASDGPQNMANILAQSLTKDLK